MANREGKALSFVRVPSNYAAGIQDGEPTPVYIYPDDGSGIPLIDPATAGNLVLQTAGGELVDAGYAADVNATAGSVVRREAEGAIQNILLTTSSVSAFYGKNIGGGSGVEGISESGTGARSQSISGTYHHEFGTVSAVGRITGVLTFLGASAAANRNAQLTELFASIPTVAGAVGTLWNDGGTIKIVV